MVAASRVQTAAAGRTFCPHHFSRALATKDAATRPRLIYHRGFSRCFSSATDTTVSSGAAADAPRVSGEKPSQPSPAALKRLLKISLPGASSANAGDRSESAAEPPHATASTVSSEARETPKEAAPQQQQQQQAAAESDEWEEGVNGTGEFGFKYTGPEPTKHGDWAHKGRVTDF